MIAVRTYELPFGENNMLRLIAFALAAYCYLQSGFAMADEAAKQLVGSWRLTSWVIQVVGGEATEPLPLQLQKEGKAKYPFGIY